MDSVWTSDVTLPSFPAARGELETDVLVIGGGITGLLCALLLTRRGVRCTVAEADRICGGVTSCTTAKLTVQHSLIYSRLLEASGPDTASMYYRANAGALHSYYQLCADIGCDFEAVPSYIYSTNDEKKLLQELEALMRIGCEASFVSHVPLPLDTVGAVRIDGQAQFHPLKFISSFVSQLSVYEKTPIFRIKNMTAYSADCSIRAEKIIVATHFPFINRSGGYFMKMYQQRSYVLALSGAKKVGGIYMDEQDGGFSLRDCGDMLLLGGGSHRAGQDCGAWKKVESFARDKYPAARTEYRFAAQDCITLDKIPYIGRYSKNEPDIFVACGYNKWGMTSSMAAAMLLSDLVTGHENEFAALFDPSRPLVWKKLVDNIAESAKNLLTPRVPRCTHLGCALKYNAAEHTWDCPCHGSRFEKDGAVIEAPATKPLNIKGESENGQKA